MISFRYGTLKALNARNTKHNCMVCPEKLSYWYSKAQYAASRYQCRTFNDSSVHFIDAKLTGRPLKVIEENFIK